MQNPKYIIISAVPADTLTDLSQKMAALYVNNGEDLYYYQQGILKNLFTKEEITKKYKKEHTSFADVLLTSCGGLFEECQKCKDMDLCPTVQKRKFKEAVQKDFNSSMQEVMKIEK
jgi:hypothetical protein